MCRYPAIHISDSYTVADGDSQHGSIPDSKAVANRNIHSQTETDRDSNFTAACATERLCPSAWRAASFTDGHRSWEHKPGAGQPDL